MKSLKLQNEIMDNIKDLKEDNIRKVLDFVLSLKARMKEKVSDYTFEGENNATELLLEFGDGLFDGEDSPNDTASKHDKYLYGI
jgi:hypothetical protein